MGSALPSDLGSRSAWETMSNTGTNPRTEDDGVWIQQASNRGASSNRFRGSESGSDVTENTKRPLSTIQTRQSNGTWDGFTPVEQGYRERRQASITTNSNNPGFHKQGAYRAPVDERVKSKWQTDQAKKEEAKVEADDSDDDDEDSDDSEFEL